MARKRRQQRLTLETYEARQVEECLGVITVRECAEEFGISTQTVSMAIATLKLVARKADSLPGENRGVWLVSHKSAMELWGQK